VLHEFQSIPGVSKTRRHHPQPEASPFKLPATAKAIYLRADQRSVTSASIEADGDVEILDKEIYIATVSEGGKLDMEMRLKRGRGYVSATAISRTTSASGSFHRFRAHPVRKCNYTVEPARLGQITITTN